MTIELESGKKYVTRNGTVTGRLVFIPGGRVFSFECPDSSVPDARWRIDGSWGLRAESQTENDIVSEYVEPAPDVKPSNPKDSIGVTKPPLSCVPCGPLYEIGAAMLDGSCKYGRHNYREIGVRSSVYYDAMLRHLMTWWEGEERAEDSGCLHLAHLAACAIILMDCPDINDDRPPIVGNPVDRVAGLVKSILAKYPEPKSAFTEKKS